jgi:AraC-like DNA-binding protein
VQRLAAIRAYIETYAHDPDLCPRRCARALGISVRSLHLALAGGDLRFSELVAHARLMLCASQLTGPQKPATVMTAAFNCGFGSMASFYRAFKRQFGTSPAELRSQTDTPDLPSPSFVTS